MLYLTFTRHTKFIIDLVFLFLTLFNHDLHVFSGFIDAW